jgi:hypothetical protein
VRALLGDFCDEPGDPFLSLPRVISRLGVRHQLLPELDNHDRELLWRSAATVREVIRKTDDLVV